MACALLRQGPGLSLAGGGSGVASRRMMDAMHAVACASRMPFLQFSASTQDISIRNDLALGDFRTESPGRSKRQGIVDGIAHAAAR